jgi:hypothetical protein
MQHPTVPRARLAVFVASACFASIALEEAWLRRALEPGGAARIWLDEEMVSLAHPLPAAKRAPSPAYVLVGTSLSGVEPRLSLAAHLEKRLARPVANDCRFGAQMGDVFAAATEELARGSATLLVEIAAYRFNRRAKAFADPTGRGVTRFSRSAPLLFAAAPWSVRALQLEGRGREDLLSGVLRHEWLLYDWSRTVGSAAGSKAQKALGAEIGDESLDDAGKVALVRDTFAHKEYARGVDAEVLSAMLEWMAERPSRFVLYFPPINGAYVRRACADDGRAWRRLERWIAGVRRRAEASGLESIDLTHALDDAPDLFLDHGHVRRARAFPILADRIARALSASTPR